MFASFLAIPILLSVLSPGAGQRTVVSTSTPRANVEVRRATVAAKLNLIRRERIRTFWGRMLTRIEAAIERLEKLIGRMESRIEIIKETDASLDTAPAEADIASAKDLLDQAKADLQTAKDAFEDMLASEEPKDAFAQVIESVRQIKKNLVEIHRLLVQAIGNIKGLRVATPTPTP